MNSSLLHAMLWLVVLAHVTVIAVYLLRKWRDQTNSAETTGDHLTKFSELHQQGILADHEFRTIKTALNDKLKAQDGTGGSSG